MKSGGLEGGSQGRVVELKVMDDGRRLKARLCLRVDDEG